MASDAVIELTDANFKDQVLGADEPVLVDVWATWCPPCVALGPVIDELARQYQGRIKVGKLDADANRETVVKYDVHSLPTLMIFKGGEPVDMAIGLQGKANLEQMIDKAIG